MKIKIEHFKRTEKFIDIKVPYYYKLVWNERFSSNSLSKTMVYGKINANNFDIRVEETTYKNGSVTFDFLYDSMDDEKAEGRDEDIFLEKNKSIEQEFEAVLKRAQDFLTKIKGDN